MQEQVKPHIAIHIEKCSNLKQIIVSILLTISLISLEVSEDIHSQLSETKILIGENRLLKARESLDYMLEWFGDELNLLEIDLIRYFQAEIYLLENRTFLTIQSFTSILKSKLLDKKLLKDIEFKLARLYLESGNIRASLKILESIKDEDAIVLKYIAYKNLDNYKKAYEYILLILDRDILNIDIWNEYIELSIRVGIEPKSIDISRLLSEFREDSDFLGFYELFRGYRMRYQTALLIDSSFKIGIQIDNYILEEAIDIYLKLMEINRSENLILEVLKKEEVLKFQFKLIEIYIKIGEFEEAFNILNKIEAEHILGKIHLYRGQILFLQGRYVKARGEFFRSLRFQDSKEIGIDRLEMIKEFLN